MKQTIETKNICTLTVTSYLLIALLVGGIVCTWFSEWRNMERLEAKNLQIESFYTPFLSYQSPDVYMDKFNEFYDVVLGTK